VAPSQASYSVASSLVLTASGASTTESTVGTNNSTNKHALALPIVLSIILAALLLTFAIVFLSAWLYLRQRRQEQKTHSDRSRDTEYHIFTDKLEGSTSICSKFMVRPSPIGKDIEQMYSHSLSRSNTLVTVPPLAVTRLDKALPEIRYSLQPVESLAGDVDKRDSTKKRMLDILLGAEDRLRTSFTSSWARNSKSSLRVEALNINRLKEYDEVNKIWGREQNFRVVTGCDGLDIHRRSTSTIKFHLNKLY
jgi:multisubunit Na+/H+ antiporter MnhC subunit